MKDDSDDQNRRTAEALKVFRKALDHGAPKGGLDRVRRAMRRELARLPEPPRRFPRGSPWLRPIWAWPAAAALLMLGGAGFLFRQEVPSLDKPVTGERNQEVNWRRAPAPVPGLGANRDRFPRVCHCTPKYSGNLRLP